MGDGVVILVLLGRSRRRRRLRRSLRVVDHVEVRHRFQEVGLLGHQPGLIGHGVEAGMAHGRA